MTIGWLPTEDIDSDPVQHQIQQFEGQVKQILDRLEHERAARKSSHGLDRFAPGQSQQQQRLVDSRLSPEPGVHEQS